VNFRPFLATLPRKNFLVTLFSHSAHGEAHVSHARRRNIHTWKKAFLSLDFLPAEAIKNLSFPHFEKNDLDFLFKNILDRCLYFYFSTPKQCILRQLYTVSHLVTDFGDTTELRHPSQTLKT
jgi:hypothetical protein